MVSAWHLFYEHPHCTDSDILTNVLIVGRCGNKRLLNAIKVNVKNMRVLVIDS